MNTRKAVVLLSGGLDSTTILYHAKARGFKPHCLIFEYGQRHKKEVQVARRIARYAKVPFQLMTIALPWQGSSLLDRRMRLPQYGETIGVARHSSLVTRASSHGSRVTRNAIKIPSTYVPARNIIFLSFAVSYAEAIGAQSVFIGANAIDYSGYPDCRPEFFKSFQNMVAKGLKTGVEGKAIKIYTPLVRKTKAQIIKMGTKLKVPYHLTWSCYRGGQKPCGKCDSCRLRQRGFDAVHLKDPS